MSEQNRHSGKREAPGLWSRYRAWAVRLDRKGRLRLRVCQALAVLAVLILGIALFLRSWIRLPEVPDLPGTGVRPGPNASQSGEPGPGDVSYEGAELPEVAKSGRKPGYYTFLLCGKDVVSNSTDTMMLITYDTKGKRISAISLLRDTMTNSSGKRGAQKRLNVVFTRNRGDSKLSEKERTENGMTALKKEVSRLTGIYPDFYVLVEWEAIGRLVDAIDGVYFEVPFDMDYDDPTPGQDLHIHQKAGYRLLDGQDAMEVIRFRKSNDESVVLYDSGRTQIQRDFMTAVLKKCLTPEILLKLPTLADIFMDNVDTDLTVGNILAFAQLAVGMDADKNVKFSSMPCYNVMYDKASMVCAIQDELLEILNDGVNPYLDEIKSSDLQLMYKKSGGGFGVTNGTLADPAVATPPVSRPAEPDEPDEPDDPAASDPDDSGSADDPGETTDPGTGVEPGDIGAIDPDDIFPDLSPDIQGGGLEDTTQAAA